MRLRWKLAAGFGLLAVAAGGVWWKASARDPLAPLRPWAVEENNVLSTRPSPMSFYRLRSMSLRNISAADAARRLEAGLDRKVWVRDTGAVTGMIWQRGATDDEVITLDNQYALDYSGKRNLSVSYWRKMSGLETWITRLLMPKPPKPGVYDFYQIRTGVGAPP